MCLGGGSMGRSAQSFYEEMRKKPDALPSLPTSGERVQRAQERGMRRVGKPQRTLLNTGYGENNG